MEKFYASQSPQAGQFNSYSHKKNCILNLKKSQSPQAGQFNSYIKLIPAETYRREIGLNPLKRVNSILTLWLDT